MPIAEINSKLMPIAINVSTSGLLDTIKSEDVTVDLTPYKFKNVPTPLLKGTQLGTADVISITRTCMQIRFYNCWQSPQQMGARFILLDL